MKKILSFVLSCVMIFAVVPIANISAASSDSISKQELISLLEYYSSELDYSSEPWIYYSSCMQEYKDYYGTEQRAEELLADEETPDEEFEAIIEELKVTRYNLIKIELQSLLLWYYGDFDFDIEFWYSVYTKESYDAYLAAKQKAEKLLTDENANLKDYKNMIEEFLTAHDNLVYVNFILGDVNSDGDINLADAILTQKCALSIIELSGNQMPCTDANEDGNVNTLDSIFIMKYSLNVPTEVERIGEGVCPYFVP